MILVAAKTQLASDALRMPPRFLSPRLSSFHLPPALIVTRVADKQCSQKRAGAVRSDGKNVTEDSTPRNAVATAADTMLEHKPMRVTGLMRLPPRVLSQEPTLAEDHHSSAPVTEVPRQTGFDSAPAIRRSMKAPSDDEVQYFLKTTGAYSRSGETPSAPAPRKLKVSAVSPEETPQVVRGNWANGKWDTAAKDSSPLCGQMPYYAGNVPQEQKQYVVVHKDHINMHLLRYFVDRVWALPRPDVIISVTGGAANFKLATDHKDKIMQGMFDGTRSLTPWFITGGTDAGIMRYVGEARAKYSPDVPLIAICSLGSVAGLKQLKTMRDGDQDGNNGAERKGNGTWSYTMPLLQQTLSAQDSAPARSSGNLKRERSALNGSMRSFAGDVLEWSPKSRNWRTIIQNKSKRSNKKHDQEREDGKHIVLSYQDLVFMQQGETEISASGRGMKELRGDIELLEDKLMDMKDRILHDADDDEDTAEAKLNSRLNQNKEYTKLNKELQELKEQEESYRQKHGTICVKLEPNHSHIIAVEEDGASKFGVEREIRAEFEACAGHNRSKFEFKIGDELPKPKRMSEVRIQQEIGKYVKRERYTWPEPYSEPDEEETHHLPTAEADDVPLVSVCVEGGPGTLDTVFESVKNATPNLLVRGSGRAADLLSDFVLLRYSESHSAHVLHRDYKQKKLYHFLFHDLKEEGHEWTVHGNDEAKSDKDANGEGEDLYCFRFQAAADWLQTKVDQRTLSDHLKKKASKIFKEVYGIDIGAWGNEEQGVKVADKAVKYVIGALQTAAKNKCWVFDLLSSEPGRDDFNGALLKCLLNGIQKVGEENKHSLWKKLKYTMMWDRDDLMGYILERVGRKMSQEDRSDVLNKALTFALQRDKVQALNALFEHSADISMYDVGNKYCYVEWAREEILRETTLSRETTETGKSTIMQLTILRFFSSMPRRTIHRIALISGISRTR